MPTIATQMRIDADLKAQAGALFSNLGLDLSGAVNIFLRQCVMHRGLPFDVKLPDETPRLAAALDEAEALAHDPHAKRYASFKEAMEDIGVEV